MRTARWLRFLAPLALVVALALSVASGDTVLMKSGVVYRGTVDRDNTIVWVYDGLKRVVVRDSKIAKIESDAGNRNLEKFQLIQPLIVHAGSMPKEVVSVQATPWNDRGRRTFQYVGSKLKPIRMEQAINELGPFLVKYRGVDGFWVSQVATGQVPREVVLGLLAKVDRKNQAERERVARFLIQAEWYTEAKAELDALLRDFPGPELRERINNARLAVVQLEAGQLEHEIEVRRKARQYHDVDSRLKTFPTKDVSPELLTEIRNQVRQRADEEAADRALADDLHALSERLPTESRGVWRKRLGEVLQALKEAPDAVRDRFDAWRKPGAETPKADTDGAKFALAMSGYVVGADAAVADLATAESYWKMRDLVHDYLASHEESVRPGLVEKIDAISVASDPAQTAPTKRLDAVTRLAQLMPPPLHENGGETFERSRLHRVLDDENAEPTEYAVLLPPEYHPLRKYPAVVALHSGLGPRAAIDWWAAEATRRGYIVVAPEYNMPVVDAAGERQVERDYQYTTRENAAAELALRDARRRYAIDSDRVFLGGHLIGGNMAWDLGLARPDLFAGVVIVSGLPAKYANRYLPHAEHMPLYVVLGDLAPGANDIVFGNILKPMIARAYDTTYVEYFKRGLEDFPEEAPAVFDWMESRQRDPYPKSFEYVTARDSDVRFFGVVIREFAAGRTTAPEAVDYFGKNLNPATIKMKSSSLSNLLNVTTTGVKRLDVWVSPKLIDFKKRLEVRVNGKPFLKGLIKPEIEPLLEDLRIRGDRQQVYWLKVSAG
jgi:pimeloyl-ACP methyl ester carboxylesterase